MFFNKYCSRIKLGISMAEILIAIAIIGILAAITLPVLKNAMPDKEEKMHQKMTYIVEQVVGQIYDDDIMYLKRSDLFKQGFQNTEKATINGVDYEGDTKFCQLFASKFNKRSSEVVCEDGKKTFTSTDNVDWYLPVTDFRLGSAEIMIDVNGSQGSNCLKGSAGCKKPDRFKYYVKPNGTVTFEQPSDVLNDKFKIIVNITNPEGGTYSIAKINENGTTGPFNSGAQYFRDLDRNTRYIVKASPVAGYFTDWQLNQIRVSIYNSDVKLNLVFHPRSTYCITLDVLNCDKSSITQCATYKIKKGCTYVYKGSRLGNYKKDSSGAYEFVGLGVEGGDYDYKCNGGEDSMSVGTPTMDADGNITVDTTTSAVYACGLYTGDYQLNVTPKSGYAISGYFKAGANNVFTQDVRLGTDNLTFGVRLRQN